jgi:hypothetical protein
MHQEEIIANLHAPNVSALNFTKCTEVDLKTQVNSNTMVVGDFNIPLPPIHRSSRPKKKINKITLELSDIIDQMDLTDVFKIFPPATA